MAMPHPSPPAGISLSHDDVGDLQPTAWLQDSIGLSEHGRLAPRERLMTPFEHDEIDALIRHAGSASAKPSRYSTCARPS